MSLAEITPKILDLPVPDLSAGRELKTRTGYAHVELDKNHPLFDDPIVRISDYGIRGSSYYSKHAWLKSGQGFDAAMKDVYLRQDIAERLRLINEFLASPAGGFIHDALGGRVDLYVTDGLRPVGLIRELYENIVPAGIRAENPEWSEEEVLKWRDHRMAKPDENAPHSTGGALDLVLSFVDLNQKVPNGFEKDIPDSILPEYYENVSTTRELNAAENIALLNRRILYHLMTAVESLRGGAGFVNNSLELWHFGTGDKLSGLVAGHPAYYAQVVDLPE